jgi:hypothetical protein
MLYFKNFVVGVFLVVIGLDSINDARKHPDSQLKSVTIGRFFYGFFSVVFGTLLVLGVIEIFD